LQLHAKTYFYLARMLVFSLNILCPSLFIASIKMKVSVCQTQ